MNSTKATSSRAPDATATKLAPVEPEPSAKSVVRARPSPLKIELPQTQAAPRLESRMEIAARLESAIATQVASVRQVAQDRGVDPTDLDAVFAFSLEGNQEAVCVNCANPNCPNYAVNYRTENQEADLVLDAVVVAEEVANELGCRYGVILYDEDVLVLKALDEDVGTDSQKGVAFERAKAFKNRHDFPDPTHRGWLDSQLQKWVPEDRSRAAFGSTADGAAAAVASEMLADTAENRIGGFVLTLGQVPHGSLRGIGREFKDRNVAVSGMAIGKQASKVARAMFKPTAEVKDAHGAREVIGERIQDLIDAVKDKSGDD